MSARNKAEDYPDFEAALQAASSRWGATHVVRQGNRSAVIYSPTSKGYERRSLSCDRGFFHWPKQFDLVDEVPENAERVVDVLDIGFDPDAPPRRETAPVSGRRAAEEQLDFFQPGDRVVLLMATRVRKTPPLGTPGIVTRPISDRARGPATHYYVEWIDERGRRKEALAARKELRRQDPGEFFTEASEARGSDRERWEKLQGEYNRLTDEMTKVESDARVKYGPDGLRYAARALQTRHDKLRASRNRVFDKLFAMAQELSPRDWSTGVPAWWVAGKLTFDDLVRPQSEPLSVTPPLAYGATTPMKEGAREMGAVREAREGRHYESAQWLEFECEPGTPTPELEEMAREFKKLVLEFLSSYARTWSIDLSSLDEDSFVWNTYASIVGHGVGLWEGDGDTGLRGDDEKKIDKALRSWHAPGSARGKLHNLAHQISNECSMLSEGAGGREASEEASIPTKAQLKIIDAFRARSLRGNPMRDSISTDGETIYSYQMPIAGRNPRGGIWIADPASAPSVTTRNHIYGLQRTFTPAEISGGSGGHQHTLVRHGSSRCDCGAIWDPDKGWIERGQHAAEHDNDRGPDTERAPAPEAAPRLQPGYAFYTPSKRKGDWKKIPNDDWEHVVIGEDEIEKADLVGYRLIDGSMHDIFEIAFAHGRRSKTTGYYAQLQTHTRGRSAAHEFPGGPATAWASDFTHPNHAIEHARREWGATHVDFHGTRNRPTVYGTKDGARWKKTLYKEKGKFHWPDKFLKGPKKLRGAIELTPVALPTHAPSPAPVQHRAAPTTIPDDDFERHLPGHSDEAQEADPRYFSRQNQKLAHVDDVFYEGKWIGWVKGPFKGARRADFFEWEIPSSSDPQPFGHSAKFGESRNRRSAFNALVRAHKAFSTSGPREARENPATDLQDAIPWVRVTRDPERYKEAIARAQKIGPIDDARKVYDLVGPALIKEDQETFIVVLIDVRQNCRGVAEIHRGQRSRVATSVLDVMRVVVASGAEGFIVVHNHPSGKAMPSDADRSLTKAIERAARPFKGETAFLDHVVCGTGEYFSFADNKLHKARN